MTYIAFIFKHYNGILKIYIKDRDQSDKLEFTW